MDKLPHDALIYVAGHRGMVGSAIVRLLEQRGFTRILKRSHAELDLTCQQSVRDFFAEARPEYVILAAARVGGIHANATYPADFIYDNLMIQSNVIDASHRYGVKRLLFLGSSCIYPKHAKQPIPEDALLSGQLEPTNEPYAIAKIAGIKLCESYNRQHGTSFRSIMPTNLYGEHDNFHPENSHVIPGLMRRIHDAKVAGLSDVAMWGTGQAKREFLHVEDMASACLHLLELPEKDYSAATQPMLSHINAGTGKDISIQELAELLKHIIGFEGSLKFDHSKPDGTPRKVLDVSCMTNLGWRYTIELEEGLRRTYEWFCQSGQDQRQ